MYNEKLRPFLHSTLPAFVGVTRCDWTSACSITLFLEGVAALETPLEAALPKSDVYKSIFIPRCVIVNTAHTYAKNLPPEDILSVISLNLESVESLALNDEDSLATKFSC
uniref:Uncharacterized protein n=1 Tax=Romanomermis culicivorax TaxID=13658 RepID=A0A915IJ47_ROMCU